MEVFRQWVEAANTLLLVAVAHSNRLGDVQHVGNVVPAVWVVRCRQVVIDHTRSVLFEQADQAI